MALGGCDAAEEEGRLGTQRPNEGGGGEWEDGEDEAIVAAGCDQLEVVNVGGLTLRVRDDPSFEGAILGGLSEGVVVSVYDSASWGAEVTDSAGYSSKTWYAIEASGLEGWVSSVYTRCVVEAPPAQPEVPMDDTGADPADPNDGSWAWPVPWSSSIITQHYGNAVDYGCNFHAGLDVDGETGDGIVAAQSGTVVHVGDMWGQNIRGPYSVIIDHGGGTYSTYSHNSGATVSVGQWVNRGDVIGYVGTMGYSTGSHLHFEILEGATYTGNWLQPFYYDCGKYRNPLGYVSY